MPCLCTDTRDSMEWEQAKDAIFMAMLSGFAGFLCLQTMRLVKSIEELNIKIAMLLERVDGHERRITRIEENL